VESATQNCLWTCHFAQDPIRWNPLTDVVDGYSPTLPHLKGLQNGDTATSAIKQVDYHSSFLFKHSSTLLFLCYLVLSPLLYTILPPSISLLRINLRHNDQGAVNNADLHLRQGAIKES
jgi:hypothetical protein